MELLFWVAVVLIGGVLSGRLAASLKMPAVLGMTLFGIILTGTGWSQNASALRNIDPLLKNFALVLILARAGLGIHKATLKKIGKTALLLAVLPCVFEALSLMVMFKFLMDFSWQAAGTVGFLLAAVSPAVVVPSMLDLKARGVAKEKEIPTLVLAGASVDDVVAITFFSLFLAGGMSAEGGLLHAFLAIPRSILLGIGGGLVLAYLFVTLFRRWNGLQVVEQSLLMVSVSMLYLWIGKQFDFAALLGIMVIGFLVLEKLPEVAEKVAAQLNLSWFWAQIFLFVFIGMAVDLNIAKKAGLIGMLLIGIGLFFRSLGVWVATAKSELNTKERCFVALAYTPKATVQAAMGALPLAAGMPEGETILAIAVLSIVFTAPMGLLLIRWGEKKLLN